MAHACEMVKSKLSLLSSACAASVKCTPDNIFVEFVWNIVCAHGTCVCMFMFMFVCACERIMFQTPYELESLSPGVLQPPPGIFDDPPPQVKADTL